MSAHTKHNTVLDRVTHELVVIPWRDPIVERVGFDACGDYVELFWLSTLGPTATWLLRRLAVTVVNNPDGFAIDLAATAASFLCALMAAATAIPSALILWNTSSSLIPLASATS